MKICVLGSGSWGTALAQVLAANDFLGFMNPDLIALMPVVKLLVFLFAGKQRRQGADKAGTVHRLQLLDRFGEGNRLFC